MDNVDKTAEETLKNKFDKLCDTEPSKVCSDIYEYEKKHLANVSKSNGRFIDQFELYYDALVETISGINYIKKDNWPTHRSVQFLLITHNLKSLFSSFDRLIKGYYEDSLILARPVYEAFIKIIYITCYPDNPYGIVAGKKFNLTNFIKHDLKLGWHDYPIFSSMSHANFYSILLEAVKLNKEKQTEPITLRFSFDKKLFELGINYTSFLLFIYLKITMTLFATSHNQVLKKEMLDKNKELILLREEDFLSHPAVYWKQLMKDINNIIKMVEEVETNKKNWKQVWLSININESNIKSGQSPTHPSTS